MSDDETNKNRGVESVVRATILGTGALLAAYNHPVEAGLLLSVTESASLQAGNVQNWASNFHNRVINKTFGRIAERAKDEHLDVESDRLEHTIRHSIPCVGNASTEEKRQMMEEIIMNAVRKAEDAAAQIEANEAMKWISQMPDEAAYIFSLLLSKFTSEGKTFRDYDPEFSFTVKLKYHGLPAMIAVKAYVYLCGPETPLSLIDEVDNNKWPKAETALIEGIEEEDWPLLDNTAQISQRGLWLAGWITSNPLSDFPDSKAGGSPT